MSEISDERYEELRRYLEEWLERPCTLEEAKEIGDGLVDFYMLPWELDQEEDDGEIEDGDKPSD